MSHVARQEGLAVNEATLRTLIEGAQGDLRLILGQLQVWCFELTGSLRMWHCSRLSVFLL
jgi:hypothetical protein